MKEFLLAFSIQFCIVTAFYIVVFIAIALDLWSGIRKAKKAGVFRTSSGFRRTCDKLAKYYNALLAITLIDVLQMLTLWQIGQQTDSSLPLVPVFSFVGSAYICFIEFKSIYETSDKKTKAQVDEVSEMIFKCLQHKDNIEQIAQEINNYVQSKKQ